MYERGDREGLNSLVKAHLDLVHDLSFKSATFFPEDKKPLFKILKMTNPNLPLQKGKQTFHQ